MGLVNILKKSLAKVRRLSRWQIALSCLLLLVIIVVGLQLVLLKTNSVLPRATLDGQKIGSQPMSEVQARLEKQGQTIQLKLGNEQKTYPASDAGVSLDTQKTLAGVPRVTLRDKLIPLGPLVRSLQKHDRTSVITRDGTKIRFFADKLVVDLHKNPIDAKAEVKDGKLVLTDAIPGQDFDTEVIQKALHHENAFAATPVVPAISKPAQLQKKELEVLQPQFDKIATQKLKVSYGDKTAEIDAKTVTSLLVATKTADGWKMTMREEAAIALAQEWAKDYNLPSGVTQIETVDGVETSRRVGASGRMIDQKAVVARLNQWLDKPSAETVPIPTAVVPPKVVYSRFYSQSSAGLQAKLDEWVAAHGGKKYQVVIQELGGQGRAASYNVEQQTIMASTYKIFLAFVAYRQAETGSINLDHVVYNGKTIEQCIELAIVQSNNECPQAIGKYLGWARVDEIIAAAGFTGVKLNNYNSSGGLAGDKLVNAKEQAKFLRQLSAGTLMNAANTDRMLGYMKRQVYRQGIPAGSHGAVVADKVGFLPEVTHDVGIVYGSKSTYALVIMSDGANNWANIKDLAQAVYEFMNE